MKTTMSDGHSFIQCREHTWGETKVLNRYGNVEVRVLCLRRGEQTSLHAHRERTEFQIPLGVAATVGTGAGVIELPYDCRAYLIPPGVLHQFRALCDGPGIVVSLTFGRIENDRM